MTPAEILICPKCGKTLEARGASLICTGEKPHCYDLSASGYVNLLPPGKMNNSKAGDGRDMLRARADFLAEGHYDKVSEAVAEAISEHCPADSITLIDAGCGEGRHLCKIADLLKKEKNCTAIGLDASKHGADMGAKVARRLQAPAFFACANIFRMPLKDSCADAVISMFAPVPWQETARVLKDGGVLAVCSAGSRHLWEMREILYGKPREKETELVPSDDFVQAERQTLTYTAQINSQRALENLFTMTPFYHRCPREGRERLLRTEALNLTVQTVITIYKRINRESL